ncbi:hypothetical protein QWJ34_12940 [Saccharibacillus sp. CPCC 101409]|uniref:hypothetical protein n=1 Tax=Saccharibacillus sp. CPCC 101409 TaxID=3058041 RepID=UPI0026740E34|nr:hypothetical protein [Saccharibacillus sp. CPCC 101409]MDO3410671.1 hypothetical protein [Saccharibacillus sp. CPCC 101409]
MFKNRSFMLGLGIGIIAGALLLQLMLLAQSGRQDLPGSAEEPAARQQTGADGADSPQQGEEAGADAEAAQGADSPAKPQSEPADNPDKPKTPAVTEPTSEEPDAPSSPEPSAPAAPDKPEESVKPAEADGSEDSQQPEEPDAPAASGDVEPQRSDAAQSSRISFEIRSGMNLQAVSKALQDAGIVKDADEFQRQADAAGVSSRLQIGDFSFAPGQSYADIISELSTPTNE